MISRVGWCQRCQREMRPKTGHHFVVAGAKAFHVYQAEHTVYNGFVPYFYKLVKSIGENVVYERLCGIHECGVEVYWDSQNYKYKFVMKEHLWERGIMPLTTWNALVMFKPSGYEI